MALTPKQQRFVEEYLIDLNATAAYLRADYRVSASVARRNAHRLLTNADVQAALHAAQSARAAKTSLTAEWVLERLKIEAELTGEGSSHAARVKAVELIGKHLAMFVDRTRHEGEAALRIKKVIVEKSRDRSSEGNPPAPGPGSVL